MTTQITEPLISGEPEYRGEQWAIDKLIPYGNNPRIHDNDQIDLIAQSLKEFGQTKPVIIDRKGRIIAGEAVWRAAIKLGWTTIWVVVVKGWSAAKKRAYRLADNKLVEKGHWDIDLLKIELSDLRLEGINLAWLGFDAAELASIFAPTGTEGLTDPDAVPALEPQAVTTLGDIWLLGAHRVRCGDCTRPKTVERVLAGAAPHLMVTDPPYGCEYDPAWRVCTGGKVSKGKVLNDDRADWADAWAHFKGDVAYVWHSGLRGDVVAQSLRNTGFDLRGQLIWAKPQLVLSRGDYHWRHEPCFYAVRKGATSHWAGDRKQVTVWEFDNNSAFGAKREQTWGHGTQKPIECMRRPIINNSKPGDGVYDPFLGVGTSLVSAEMTGRICYGIELNPAYVDVIVRRWQAFTGREAVLEATGQTFAACATERLRPIAAE